MSLRAATRTHEPTDNGEGVVELVDVVRTYRLGGEEVHALRGVNLSVHRGELLAIMGRSGSGKSTLLNVVGCLDRPTRGTIRIDGQDVTRLRKGRLPRIRREKIGFVFQQFNLIPTLTAMENVMLPLEYTGLPERERKARAKGVLERVGLADRIHHRPLQLSGGQQQRVAIARALASQPAIILADEPTGALDTQVAASVLELLRSFSRDFGQTVIIVTHDPGIGAQADRVVRLSDGHIVAIETNETNVPPPNGKSNGHTNGEVNGWHAPSHELEGARA